MSTGSSLSLSLRRPCSRSFRDDVRVLLQSLNESLVTPAVLAVFFFFCRFLKFARPPGHMLSSIYITIYYLFFFSFLKRSLSKRDLGISEKKTLRNKRLFHFGGSVCLPHNRTRCNGLRSVSATREVHGFEHWRALLSAPLFSKEILLWKMKRNAIVTFSLGAPKRSYKSMGESLAERRLFFGKRKKKVKV